MKAFDFDAYRWKTRPLLVFAPDAADERLQRQYALTQQAGPGLAERDMLVIRVIGQDTAYVDGTPLPKTAATQLRTRFGVPPEAFAVLLVGKDGGVKRTEDDVTPMEPIFQQVDGMPMRRQEMRQE
ncbi:MAG: DUF4174 domain-containing protein [Phycisphaerae bacterium]